LGELEGDGSLPVTRIAANFSGGVLDGLNNSSLRFTSRLTIGDCNDQDGFSQLARSSGLDNKWFNDFLSETRAHGGQSFELNHAHKTLDVRLVFDVIALLVRVHEANVHAVVVKEGCSVGNAGKDQFEVFDTFPTFLELHGTTVIYGNQYMLR
jgi:hypothetical protein